MSQNNSITGPYYIYVAPANKNFPPHVWKEGGIYTSKNLANQYAEQLRQNKQEHDERKNFYDKVDVITFKRVKVQVKDLEIEIDSTLLTKNEFDVDFNGHYMIRFEKDEMIWKAVNAMNGYGYNCKEEFINEKVTLTPIIN